MEEGKRCGSGIACDNYVPIHRSNFTHPCPHGRGCPDTLNDVHCRVYTHPCEIGEKCILQKTDSKHERMYDHPKPGVFTKLFRRITGNQSSAETLSPGGAVDLPPHHSSSVVLLNSGDDHTIEMNNPSSGTTAGDYPSLYDEVRSTTSRDSLPVQPVTAVSTPAPYGNLSLNPDISNSSTLPELHPNILPNPQLHTSPVISSDPTDPERSRRSNSSYDGEGPEPVNIAPPMPARVERQSSAVISHPGVNTSEYCELEMMSGPYGYVMMKIEGKLPHIKVRRVVEMIDREWESRCVLLQKTSFHGKTSAVPHFCAFVDEQQAMASVAALEQMHLSLTPLSAIKHNQLLQSAHFVILIVNIFVGADNVYAAGKQQKGNIKYTGGPNAEDHYVTVSGMDSMRPTHIVWCENINLRAPM